MVSVKRFVQDEPALVKATGEFVRMFAGVSDPVVAVASRAGDVNARMAWTLLGTDLYQDMGLPEMEALLSALYEKFPDDKLWNLPVPTAAEINEVIETVLDGRHWELAEHAAGIFWSVGLFVRRHPDLAAWAHERNPEEMWRDLGEIYFMGKSKPRPKAAAAIYRLLAPAPLGLGIECRDASRMPPLPLTMGARRFLAILGPAREDGFADLEPAEKQKMMDAFSAAVCPKNPYAVAHALQFFLEEGTEEFVCRERTRSCSECPLYEYCDYAEQHSGGAYAKF